MQRRTSGAAADAARINLRPPRGTLIGRAQDLDALGALFDHGEPLVTVTGPGGIGKTRLATEFALARVDGLAGGAWFADLSEARSVDSIAVAVARALGIDLDETTGRDPDVAAQVGRALAQRGPLLLVLDNFEQVVACAPATVSRWLRDAPAARVLVTTRVLLRVPGECVYELSPLALPDGAQDVATAAASRLLLEHAARLRGGGVALGESSAAAVAGIVRALDGMPLAIELAAARLNTFDPDTLLARLAHGLEVLAHGPRGVAQRQATLRGSIEWSWELLAPHEQRTLAQCAVFRGGFTLEAAEAVIDPGPGSPPVLDVLQALREASLVYVSQHAAGPTAQRLGLYHSIREFADERLAATASTLAACRRHAAYYLREADAALGRLGSQTSAEAFAWLSLERDNLRAVVDLVIGRDAPAAADVDLGLHACLVLAPVYNTQGPLREGRELLDALIAAAQRAGDAVDASKLTRALTLRSSMHRSDGQGDAMLGDLLRARIEARRAGDPALEARVLRSLASQLGAVGRAKEAREVGRRMVRVLGQRGAGERDEGPGIWTVSAAGADPLARGVSREYLESAAEIFRRAGNAKAEARTTTSLAMSYLEEGRTADALACFERALEAHRRTIDWWFESYALFGLALVQHDVGRLELAIEGYGEALRVARAVGDVRLEVLYRGYLAIAVGEEGDLERAVDDLGEVAPVLERVGERRYQAVFLAHRSACEAALGRAEAAEAGIRAVEAMGDGLSASSRAVASLARGHLEAARAASLRDPGAAAELRGQVARRLATIRASHERASLDVRLALRLAERALGGAPASPAAVVGGAFLVHQAGDWFQSPGGSRIDCAKRPVMRLLVARLLDARLRRPGEGVSAQQLIEAAWPGERILPDAAMNRLYVALTKLRNMGLRSLLVAVGKGYALDPAVPLQIARE